VKANQRRFENLWVEEETENDVLEEISSHVKPFSCNIAKGRNQEDMAQIEVESKRPKSVAGNQIQAKDKQQDRRPKEHRVNTSCCEAGNDGIGVSSL